MKNIIKISVLAMVIILISSGVIISTDKKEQAVDSDGSVTAKVTYLKGKASVKPKGSKKWKPAKVGNTMATGDRITTNKLRSRLELLLNNSNIVRSQHPASITVGESSDDKGKADIDMKAGKVWANIPPKKGRKKFKIKTPVAVIGVRGTKFRINVDEDKTTQVNVYRGSVNIWEPPSEIELKEDEAAPGVQEVGPPMEEIAPPVQEVSLDEWMETLEENMQIIISPDGSRSKKKFSEEDEAEDSDWVKWNQERDAELKKQKELDDKIEDIDK